jgi:hypothetical protein
MLEKPEERQCTSELSQEQDNLVKLAERRLTDADCEIIEARKRNLNLTRESIEPRGEGPSQDKGKAPDPRNWGNAALADEEVDLDAQ